MIAKVGVHRVGSNIEEDEAVGCTLMVSMECFSSTILDPFIVMTASMMEIWQIWQRNGLDILDQQGFVFNPIIGWTALLPINTLIG